MNSEENTNFTRNPWNYLFNVSSQKLQVVTSSVEIYCGINLYETEVKT